MLQVDSAVNNICWILPLKLATVGVVMVTLVVGHISSYSITGSGVSTKMGRRRRRTNNNNLYGFNK